MDISVVTNFFVNYPASPAVLAPHDNHYGYLLRSEYQWNLFLLITNKNCVHQIYKLCKEQYFTVYVNWNAVLCVCVCVCSSSRNDVPRVAQLYGTSAAHTRRRASVLVVFVVVCVYMHSFAGLIRRTPPPTFSDGQPGLVDRVLALHAGRRGFDSHRGHMSERFFRIQ